MRKLHLPSTGPAADHLKESSMSASHRIYLPYAAQAPWTVRRDIHLLGQFRSFQAALSSAHVFAQDLHERSGQDVDIVVQDERGDWTIEQVASAVAHRTVAGHPMPA
jgi:hypothetical protein